MRNQVNISSRIRAFHCIPLQIKGFFSRYKKALGDSKTANISVAAIDSVEMDGDEEDAMLEAIQGLALDHAPTRFLNGGPDFDFQAVQQLSEADKKVELKDRQVPVPQQIDDYETNLELASVE